MMLESSLLLKQAHILMHRVLPINTAGRPGMKVIIYRFGIIIKHRFLIITKFIE